MPKIRISGSGESAFDTNIHEAALEVDSLMYLRKDQLAVLAIHYRKQAINLGHQLDSKPTLIYHQMGQ